MKRIPLILSLALLLLLPAIALYPMLHASAEKDGVDSSTAIQEAAPSEAAPSEAAQSEAAPSEAAPSDSAVAAPAAPVAVSGSIDTDDFPLADGQQQALHRYMTAYYTTLGDLTEASTDGVFCADDIAAYEQAVWRSIVAVRSAALEDLSLRTCTYTLTVTDISGCEDRLEVSLTEDNTQQFRGVPELSKQYGVLHTFLLRRNGDDNWQVADHDCDNGGFYGFVYDPETGTDARLAEMLTQLTQRHAQQSLTGRELSCSHPYDRTAAVSYLMQWVARRDPDWAAYDDYGGNCINFASQTLYAGGIPMSGHWYWAGEEDYSYAWINVGGFTDWVTGDPSPLVCDPDAAYYTGHPGDLILMGIETARNHATTISSLVADEEGRTVDYLLCSNTDDLLNFPAGAYYYTNQRLIRIFGWE